MRNILTFCIMALLPIASFTQTIQETKDFIKQQVKSNPPHRNYDTFVFFSEDILKADADDLAGVTLANDFFENLFIYAHDIYLNGRSGWLISVASIIDIRDMTSISIQENKTENGSARYNININITGIKFNTKSMSGRDNKKQNTNLNKVMKIEIGSSEAAQRVKKAIIHLGSLYGVTVTDGDNLFR